MFTFKTSVVLALLVATSYAIPTPPLLGNSTAEISKALGLEDESNSTDPEPSFINPNTTTSNTSTTDQLINTLPTAAASGSAVIVTNAPSSAGGNFTDTLPDTESIFATDNVSVAFTADTSFPWTATETTSGPQTTETSQTSTGEEIRNPVPKDPAPVTFVIDILPAFPTTLPNFTGPTTETTPGAQTTGSTNETSQTSTGEGLLGAVPTTENAFASTTDTSFPDFATETTSVTQTTPAAETSPVSTGEDVVGTIPATATKIATDIAPSAFATDIPSVSPATDASSSGSTTGPIWLGESPQHQG